MVSVLKNGKNDMSYTSFKAMESNDIRGYSENKKNESISMSTLLGLQQH